MTKLSAVVSSTGVLDRGQGVTSAARLGLGGYSVVFNQNVSACTYVATPGGIAGTTPHGHLSVGRLGGNANGVFIAARNGADTTDLDISFHLIVLC